MGTIARHRHERGDIGSEHATSAALLERLPERSGLEIHDVRLRGGIHATFVCATAE